MRVGHIPTVRNGAAVISQRKAGSVLLMQSTRPAHVIARVASPARDASETFRRSNTPGSNDRYAPSQNSPASLGYDPVHPPHSEKPGTIEDTIFPQHWSVRLWRDYNVPEDIKDESLPLSTRVQNTIRVLREGIRMAGVFDSTQSLAYWTYHLPRMGFFTINAALGVLYSTYTSGGSTGFSARVAEKTSKQLDIPSLVKFGLFGPVSEALVMFYQDYQNIRNGVYKLPWDMTTRGHRQSNPGFVINNVGRFLDEAKGTMVRRDKREPESVWMNSNMYPDYYLNTWHYQTDGWLSDKSAAVYETSTETVFLGRQDAMQRQSLVPISEFMKENASKDGAGFKLLDIATGTGRYATFVKDNFPKMGITQLDLSPFYLARARENLEYWRKQRGGKSPEDSVASKDTFIHAPAENIPVPDESFDIVLCTYLFHEIPKESRQKVAKEMERTCKPGGLVILTDGCQFGDRPNTETSLANFEAFNEPHWGTHVRTHHGKLFSDLGLVPHKKVLASSSKVLSWKKLPRN